MSKLLADKSHQYFLAIVPPPPVYEQAQDLKLYFKDHYQSKASLNSPPHITLHMPFRWKEKKELELFSKLEEFTAQFKAFELRMKNFSCFSPKVIFIDVVKSEELNALQKQLHRFCKRELNLFNADYKAQPFYPHLTLAFRDLKKPAFTKAWEEFKEKEFSAEFLVDRITLLRHNTKVWEVFHDFTLTTVSV